MGVKMTRAKTTLCMFAGVALAMVFWSRADEVDRTSTPPSVASQAGRWAASRVEGGAVAFHPPAGLRPGPAEQVGESDQPAYLRDEVMVRVRRDADLAAVALRHGFTLDRDVGRSGYGALNTGGLPLAEVRQELAADASVLDVAPVGVIHGAGEDLGESLLWNQEVVTLPEGSDTFESWVVAVLDSGVAYEEHTDDAHSYVAVGSLEQSAIVAPWDFVNDDEHPNDDHQHGTHVASIIASSGPVPGVAPAVSLMPLKVLDADNNGDELDLVEAIHYAIENGADVINMSLTFGQAYAPSMALAEALVRAWQEQVVMVAASGNEAANYVAYPAAHPRVIAVGASELKNKNGKQEPAAYTNLSTRIDLLAPGGNLDEDENKDGYPDGIVAETFALNQPLEVGYQLYAGTSQAAATVSGAVVRLLEAGVQPWQVLHLMQRTANTQNCSKTWKKGYGAGLLDITAALDDVGDTDLSSDAPAEYFASLLPWLKPSGSSNVRPAALITVLDAFGEPVADADVYATYWGEGGKDFTCTTDEAGQCEKKGSKTDLYDDEGAVRELGWAARVNTVIVDGLACHPGNAFFATDALEILLTAVEAESALDGSLLAFYWDQDEDEVLGKLVEGYSIVDMGTGLATSPLGVVATLPVLDNYSVSSELELDLDGTGLATSPLGLLPVWLQTMDGSGLATSPLGLSELNLLVLSGSGLATSPLGLTANDLLLPGMDSFDSELLDFQADPVLVGQEVYSDADLSGTAIGALIEDGGWVTQEGLAGAMVVAGSGWGGIAPVSTGTPGEGAGNEAL